MPFLSWTCLCLMNLLVALSVWVPEVCTGSRVLRPQGFREVQMCWYIYHLVIYWLLLWVWEPWAVLSLALSLALSSDSVALLSDKRLEEHLRGRSHNHSALERSWLPFTPSLLDSKIPDSKKNKIRRLCCLCIHYLWQQLQFSQNCKFFSNWDLFWTVMFCSNNPQK